MTHKGFNKNFLLFLVGLSLLFTFMSAGFVSAEGELYGQVQRYSSVLLTQQCTNGTGTCDGCNITSILDPDQVPALKNVAMAKDGSVYTYSFSNTSKLGFYDIKTLCYDLSGSSKANSYKIEVTTTGKNDDLSFWISIIIVVLALIMLILGFTFDNIYIAYMSGVLFLIAGMLVYIRGFGSIQDMYSNAIGMVLLAFGILAIFATAFEHNGEQLSAAFGIQKEEKDPHDYFNEEI